MRGVTPGDLRKNLVLSSFFSLPSKSFLRELGGRAADYRKDTDSVDLGVQELVGGDAVAYNPHLDGGVKGPVLQDFRDGGDAGLQIAMGAITSAQRSKHRAWLTRLVAVQSAVELVQIIERLRTSTPWKYSTTCTKIGEILGAVKRLDMYGGHRRLKQLVATAIFADYKRGIHLKSLEEEVAFPLALTSVDVEKVLDQLAVDQGWETGVALALQWGTAARPNCVLQLQVRNVCVDGDGAARVRFVAGKGVAARGEPYTVHTRLGGWGPMVQRWLNARIMERFVFNRDRAELIKKGVRGALRRLNPRYGLRSIRRGAAVCMAERGTPITVIMHFTGHRSQATCLRYLDWGWHWGEMAVQGTAAAGALWDPDSGSSSPEE